MCKKPKSSNLFNIMQGCECMAKSSKWWAKQTCSYYLCHHCIYWPSASSTTPFMILFNRFPSILCMTLKNLLKGGGRGITNYDNVLHLKNKIENKLDSKNLIYWLGLHCRNTVIQNTFLIKQDYCIYIICILQIHYVQQYVIN